jgi:hypothetical protein
MKFLLLALKSGSADLLIEWICDSWILLIGNLGQQLRSEIERLRDWERSRSGSEIEIVVGST